MEWTNERRHRRIAVAGKRGSVREIEAVQNAVTKYRMESRE
jgi:hypothetical protein